MPRFVFITWHAMKDRLATGQCMQRWSQGHVCLFCGEHNETREHLFFACPYTFTLWIEEVGSLIGAQPDPDWFITLEQLARPLHDRLNSFLVRLAFQVVVYHL